MAKRMGVYQGPRVGVGRRPPTKLGTSGHRETESGTVLGSGSSISRITCRIFQARKVLDGFQRRADAPNRNRNRRSHRPSRTISFAAPFRAQSKSGNRSAPRDIFVAVIGMGFPGPAGGSAGFGGLEPRN